MSAEEQTNWCPRALGPMSLRPGWQYLLTGYGSTNRVWHIPFVKAIDQTALLECSNAILRPLVSEAPVTRVAVVATVTNGDFSSGTGWTITATGGSTGTITGGKLVMACVAVESYVTCSRSVTIDAGDTAKEHAFRIVVDNGPVIFRCGTVSAGTDNLIPAVQLDTGTYSLAFTPGAATVYVEFESRVARETRVDSITVEGAGVMTLPAPWDADDLPLLRYTQSGDTVFVALNGIRQRKITRHDTTGRSWGISLYLTNDGPFFGNPTDSDIKLYINKAVGNGTVVASRPFFKSTHVGAILRAFTAGYNFIFDLGQVDVWTPAVRINGVGLARSVSIVTTGTWSGTLTVQKSYIGEDSGFTDTTTTITTNTTTNVGDSSDNVAVWVRVGFKTGDYTSGLASVRPIYGTGGGSTFSGAGTTSPGGRTGVARITAVASSTSASVEILSLFSSSEKTSDWAEGEWSDVWGWPSAVCIQESRLTWFGRDRIWASVTDAYSSFDPGAGEEAGPLQRSIGTGPVQIINWAVPLTQTVIGTEAAEFAMRSSNFGEPLTPTNFSLKDFSTFGSARVDGVKIDRRAIFADKSGQRLMEISYNIEANDYVTVDLTRLCPDLFLNNAIQRLAVQRQPDTRIHCMRADGTVAVLVYDPLEEVRAWWEVETDGDVTDMVVLPGAIEDKVYYSVKRTIGGTDTYYLERWAREDECVGATLNKQADSFLVYSGSAVNVIPGLSHLAGKEVVVWANGADLSPGWGDDQTLYTVSGGGSVTLANGVTVTSAIVGLPYRARFKSTKLAYAAAGGSALTKPKRVPRIGPILHKTHNDGLRCGKDFDNLFPLPRDYKGADVGDDDIYAHYDVQMQTFVSDWDTDARMCLEAQAPRPCTALANVLDVVTSG